MSLNHRSSVTPPGYSAQQVIRPGGKCSTPSVPDSAYCAEGLIEKVKQLRAELSQKETLIAALRDTIKQQAGEIEKLKRGTTTEVAGRLMDLDKIDDPKV